MNKESERFKGNLNTQGGRSKVRTVLYIAMISAIKSNPVFKAHINDYWPQENLKR